MTSKKLIILVILEVLKKYSDQNHKLTQNDIILYVKKDFDIDVERKAVSRNISYLCEFGYEIETKADNGEGIWLVTRDFEQAELRLLIDSVYSSKFLTNSYSKALINKLNKKGSMYFKNRTKHILNIKDGAKYRNADLFYNIDIIDEAINIRRQISFTYNSYGVDKKLHPKSDHKYIVNPYQILINNGRYYIITNFDKYNNIVIFRIDLITNITIKKDLKRKPIRKLEGHENGLELSKIKTQSPYMFSGNSETIVIQTKSEMIGTFIDWFGFNIKIKEIDNETIEVRFKASINAMRYWCLQYGLYIKIIRPKSLVDIYISDVKKISEKY